MHWNIGAVVDSIIEVVSMEVVVSMTVVVSITVVVSMTVVVSAAAHLFSLIHPIYSGFKKL